MVFMEELSVQDLFCVVDKIWRPACGSRLSVRSGWDLYDQRMSLFTCKLGFSMFLVLFLAPLDQTSTILLLSLTISHIFQAASKKMSRPSVLAVAFV